MATWRNRALELFAITAVAWSPLPARAQEPEAPAAPAPEQQEPPAAEQPEEQQPPAPAETEPAAPPAAEPAEPEPAEPEPVAEPGEPPGTGARAVAPPTVFSAPVPPPPQPRREKPFRPMLGLEPAEPDFGAEADIVSSLTDNTPPPLTKKWSYSLKGWFRAPMRVGYGPRNDLTEGSELHAPPRMVGASPYEWNYIGVTPNPMASLYLKVENTRVSGNVILSTDTFFDAGYDNLVKIGGVAQAYVTLKFPDAFGTSGGLAWTVGAFSSRYGLAGPRNESTGYYGTYLFGRTHTAGWVLTGDVDLSPDVELVLEHGLGAKLEPVPFVSESADPPPVEAEFLPDQGPEPQGSTFLHHAHAALYVSDWLRIAGHYLYSWTPDDYTLGGVPSDDGAMTVYGGEVHVDGEAIGSGYLGYSHVEASDILPLGDAIEVLHSTSGFSFKENYFGLLDLAYFRDVLAQTLPAAEDSGTVDTLLFQYILRLAPLLGRSPKGMDVALALFGMYNHVVPITDVSQDRLKFGAELQFAPVKFLSVGARFDRVLPDGPNTDPAYSAFSPRLIFHSNWLSREYIIVNYTHFFLGPEAFPTQYRYTPADELLAEADPDVVMLAALVAF